jgi:phosphoserine aminotransferase
MMDYRIHIENGSMLNTPPVFAVYVCMLTLRWLKKQGGVPVIEKLNDAKANLLYNTLDTLPLFTPKVAREDRSLMNVVWIMEDAALEKQFLAECKAQGMVGIKGHRTVGGFRASLYNALTIDSVKALTDLMTDFAKRKG